MKHRSLCRARTGILTCLLLTLFSALDMRAVEVIEADFCVYGGTSGGVIAAVQASRLGKRAVIVEPGQHLGGMTASGLSWTDVGDASRVRAVSGMAREVYERIGAHYGQKPGSAFDVLSVEEQKKLGVDYEKPPSLAFEPSVAEKVFEEMVRDAGVKVIRGANLKSVVKDGAVLREIVMTDGRVIRAKVFLDATYEGDLMDLAGVSFTIGREANAQYGETVNGVQEPATRAPAGRFTVKIDPYVVRRKPASGVLPYLLQDEPFGEIGSADTRVQSYNYRVCLTDNPANRIPLTQPAHYRRENYELVTRWIEAQQAAGTKLTLRSFLKYDPLQNGKYDFNNRWAISTDFIGGAHNYPQADAATRVQIAKAHEDYLRGFFHFLATDRSVPTNVNKEMSRFGLCKDEFAGTGGWPHQIYVREGRRMVSDFVMIEQHCTGQQAAPQSIALGAYGTDMHAVRRIVVNGQPVNEGTNAVPVPQPYPIAYGAIVPKAAECENLFVTFGLSASHVAFGSIRMEPVFMALSQSAAQAAVIAIENKTPVQAVPYSELRAKLVAAGLVLSWPPSP